jgi:hypothetical protein
VRHWRRAVHRRHEVDALGWGALLHEAQIGDIAYCGLIIRGSARALCLGSVLLTAAGGTPTLPSDFPAFKLTNSPDDQGPASGQQLSHLRPEQRQRPPSEPLPVAAVGIGY